EDLFVLIARDGTASDSLKILTHLDKIPAMKMYGALKTLERYWAPIPVVNLSEVIFKLNDGSTSPVMPGVVITGDKSEAGTKKNVDSVESPAYVMFDGTAVFKKDKLVGWLNE